MFRVSISSIALLAANVAQTYAQESTADGLGNFINGAQSGLGAINSALSAQSTQPPSSTSSPSATSASPTAAPASSSAAPHKGLSSGARTGIIVGVVLGVVLLIGILLGICCCLMLRKRRRRKRNHTPTEHEKVTQQHSTPLMAAGALPHGRQSQAPSLSQHPAMRPSNENPFSDNAARASTSPHSSHHSHGAGLAGATAAGAAAGYGLHHHRKSGDHHPLSNSSHVHDTDYGHGSGVTHPAGYNSLPHQQPGHADPPTGTAHAPASNHGHGAGIAGATAAGAAAGYGANHHEHSGQHHSSPHDPYDQGVSHGYGFGVAGSDGYGPNTHPKPAKSHALADHTRSQNANHSHGPGLTGATAAGAATGYGLQHHRKSGEHRPLSSHPYNRDSTSRNASGTSIPSEVGPAGYGRPTSHSFGENSPFTSPTTPPIPRYRDATSVTPPAAARTPGAHSRHASGQHSPLPNTTPTHPNSHRHEPGAVGAAAAGAATGYGLHHHNRSSSDHHQPQNMSSNHATHYGHGPSIPGTTATGTAPNYDVRREPTSVAHRSHETALPNHSGQHGTGAGTFGATAAGPIAAHGMHSNGPRHSFGTNPPNAISRGHKGGPTGPVTLEREAGYGSANQRASEEYQPTSTAAHAQNLHSGLPPSLSSGVADHKLPTSSTTEPFQTSTTTQSQTTTYGLPSDNMTGPGSHATQPSDYDHGGLTRGSNASSIPVNATAIGTADPIIRSKDEKRHSIASSKSRSRSRSHSRPRSGVLPTHTNNDRPPTPFGLGAMGQPYEDKHSNVLEGEVPTQAQRRSLQKHEEPLDTYEYEERTPTMGRSSRGFDTPPEVPSRSPNRHSVVPNESYESSISNNTTSSNSGETYLQGADPYKPATPVRYSVPPWEQHQYRYSGNTPPQSAGIVPPAPPWESHDFAQQRRHSPRASIDASGRRHSRSPATSINGKPRRLRFDDLPADDGYRSHESSHMPGAYDDGYDTGVGQAL